MKHTKEEIISILKAPSFLRNLDKIWNNDQKIAANRTNKNAKLNSMIPGLVITKTPENPRTITNHLLIETFSFNNKKPKIATINGETKLKEAATLISKFFKPKKYRIVAVE